MLINVALSGYCLKKKKIQNPPIHHPLKRWLPPIGWSEWDCVARVPEFNRDNCEECITFNAKFLGLVQSMIWIVAAVTLSRTKCVECLRLRLFRVCDERDLPVPTGGYDVLTKKTKDKKTPNIWHSFRVPDFVSAAAAVFAKITIRHYNGSCFVLNGNEPSNEILK